MKKTYMILLAMVLSVLGASTAMAQKIYRAELDASMFKAWNGVGADAQEVEPTSYIGKGGATVDFACEMNLYKEIGAGSLVFGNTNVYSRWYANLTGTKTITFKGTAGVQLRVLMNRPDAEEGAEDPNGGQSVEENITIGDNGEVTLNVGNMEFVHLNAIKLGWGSPAGAINSIELEGTVKPVTGILSMINNGDAEGDDLSSFPVSYDGPNNGDTANDLPEIVGGGVGGSKCFKVTTFPEPTETWHTQFYIKADETMPKGTKFKLKMSVKADEGTWITTSGQAAPRVWKGGFIDAFEVTTEWKDYTWEGEIGVDDFQSAAFDLSNGEKTEDGFAKATASNTFYFDNIEFGIDLGGNNPMSQIKGAQGNGEIRLNLNDLTNMKKLVAASSTKTLIYPNELVTVLWNGKTCNILSVEGFDDGNLYIFLEDMDGEGGEVFEDEEAKVVVSFKNPEDAEHRIVFEQGKWAGEAMPDLTGIICDYDEELGYDSSYLWGAPELAAIVPEAGSFNLPEGLKEFTVTFNQDVDCSSVVATLAGEKLAVAPATGWEKTITLTRTGAGNLSGDKVLVISKATGKGGDLDETIEVSYGFGKLTIDPDDQPKDILDLSKWNETADGAIPEGYFVKFGEEDRPGGSTQGSGSRMFVFADGGDFTHGLYFREGYVEYGSTEGFELALEEGKKYNIHFNSAMWKGKNNMKFQIMPADDPDNVLYTEDITDIVPNMNGNKNAINGSVSTDVAFVPEMTGNYLLRWISDGFVELLLGDPTVKYVPNTLGVEETNLLETAIANAKSVRDANADERYNGAAFDALVAAITKYEAEKDSYTAPSSFKNAAAALDAAAQAMKDHRNLCDAYDPLPEQALEVVENYADSKFAKTDIYANLVALVAKYAGEKKIVKTEDPDTGEEIETEVLEIKVLKDDAELVKATTDLKEGIAMAIGHKDVSRSGKGMFTEGPSKVYNEWNSSEYGTGYGVLVDRIRQGAEALQSLGVAADDELIVAANNTLSDDDALAEAIKTRVKVELYGKLKDPNNTVFEAIVNEETLEETPTTYNMTVFVKNPNIYALNAPAGYKGQETIPGWDVIDCRGFSAGWSELGTDKIPVDVMFSNWSGSFTVSQTITDLPAGMYTLQAAFADRRSADEVEKEGYDLEQSYFYYKSTETAEDSVTASATNIGQAFPVVGGNGSIQLDEVVVTDGLLTIGVQAGQNSRVFFNEVKILMAGAAKGFDYGTAYNTELAGIDNKAVTPKVRALELYDLNGRRIITAQKGIQIVRKHMSDGTVRVEKVVKK